MGLLDDDSGRAGKENKIRRSDRKGSGQPLVWIRSKK